MVVVKRQVPLPDTKLSHSSSSAIGFPFFSSLSSWPRFRQYSTLVAQAEIPFLTNYCVCQQTHLFGLSYSSYPFPSSSLPLLRPLIFISHPSLHPFPSSSLPPSHHPTIPPSHHRTIPPSHHPIIPSPHTIIPSESHHPTSHHPTTTNTSPPDLRPPRTPHRPQRPTPPLPHVSSLNRATNTDGIHHG